MIEAECTTIGPGTYGERPKYVAEDGNGAQNSNDFAVHARTRYVVWLVKSTIDHYTVEYKGTFLSVTSVDKYLLTDHQYFHVTLTTNQKAELKILNHRSVVVTVIESDNGVDKSYFAAGVPAKST